MKIIKMTAYSILKNEDAIPYAGKNLLVVADGLGGSGSFIHEIDKYKFHDMEESFYKSAFNDFDKEQINNFHEYFKNLFKDLIDERNDTSALWASRIVCARYIYAVSKMKQYDDLTSLKTRESLTQYILNGLSKTKEEFQLEKGKYFGQLLLPTTLASIKYSCENNKIIAEVLWAGDSRCYALSKDGLLQLSKDDEDASGAITNLFYEGNQKVKLNYKKYEFNKPCILFVVSDGFFDPFDSYENLGLENIMLDGINNSVTINDFKQYLINKYNEIHADDASIALAAIGFDDLNAMKNYLQSRAKEILKIQNNFSKYQELLQIYQQSKSEYDDYMYNRTMDKYETIKEIVTTSLLENKSYSFQFLKNAFEEIKSQSKEDYLKQYQERIIEQIEFDFNERNLPQFKQNNQSKEIKKICENNLNYLNYKEQEKSLQSRMSLVEHQKENLLTSYFNFKKEVNLQSESTELKEIVKKIEVKIKIEFEIFKNSILKQNKTIKMNLNLLQKLYKKQVTRLMQKYKNDFNLVKRDILLNKYNLKIESLDLTTLKNQFYLYLDINKDSVILEILEQIKEKETIIDYLYNSTRLKFYRVYYKYQKKPSKNFLKFNDKLKQLNLEYMKHLN